jgi:DNA-binding XRE family transcriptional regulator
MIKNEREYRITKGEVGRFQQALSNLLAQPVTADPDEQWKRRVFEDAFRSQLADLEAEVEEFELLRINPPQTLSVSSLSELPAALIRARIAAGLTQRELAERLGLKEQQVQRYEATDYESAKLTRLVEVASALGVELHGEMTLTRNGRAQRDAA